MPFVETTSTPNVCGMQEYCLIENIFLENLFVPTHKDSWLHQGEVDHISFVVRTLLNSQMYLVNYNEALNQFTAKCTDVNSTVVVIFDMSISFNAFKGLAYREWTTDSVIDGFGCLLKARSTLLDSRRGISSTKYKTAFIFNTCFYVSLMSNNNRSCFDYSRVTRHNKNVDLTDYEMLLFPVHLGETQHWILVAVYPRKKEVYCIDSMDLHSYGVKVSVNILKFLYGWYQQHKTVEEFDLASWKLFDRAIISRKQFNCDDCGIYVMMYMDCLCNGLSIGWIDSSEMVDCYRSYIACCLMAKQILD